MEISRYFHLFVQILLEISDMGWLRLVGCLKIQVSFAKELYKRDLYSAKRPVFLSILLIVATPYVFLFVQILLEISLCVLVGTYVIGNISNISLFLQNLLEISLYVFVGTDLIGNLSNISLFLQIFSEISPYVLVGTDFIGDISIYVYMKYQQIPNNIPMRYVPTRKYRDISIYVYMKYLYISNKTPTVYIYIYIFPIN